MHKTDDGDGHQNKIIQVNVPGDTVLREIVGASTSDKVEITQDLLLCGKPLASVTITKKQNYESNQPLLNKLNSVVIWQN